MKDDFKIHISSIQDESSGRTSRVAANVNGIPIWFESNDVKLRPSAEAFAGAFLVAGLKEEARLVMTDPLSPGWRKGVSMLLKILNEWWGFPILEPESPEHPGPDFSAVDRSIQPKAALLFSGGVDSFYSLLRGRFKPEYVVFLHGYDIPLQDTRRMDAYLKTHLEAAEKTGVKPVLIRTNLREHPLIQQPYWMHIHGGALAGAGHFLTEEIGRFLISATNPYSVNLPWGSHWRIDELWSSEKLHVVHTGAERTRNDKLREMAAEPIIQKHLRVCLENLSPTGNCSRCEKCLRTMLVLHQCGKLDDFRTVFDLSEPLAKRFEKVKPPTQTMGILLKGYEDILKRGVDPELDRSVRNFLERYHTTKNTRNGKVRRILGPKVTTWLREKIYS